MTAPGRFYREAAAVPRESGFVIELDGRTAKTKAGAPLAAPTLSLARAIALEWAAQGERIEPATMRLTRLMTTAIDLGPTEASLWRDHIVAYAMNDLLCYRADDPAGLIERQAACWDPYLDWARTALGLDLRTASGVSPVTQSPAAAAATHAALEALSPAVSLGVRVVAEICGSGVLALALQRGAFRADAIYAAARHDEVYQAERWGVVEEAAARERALRADFDAAAAFVRLLRD